MTKPLHFRVKYAYWKTPTSPRWMAFYEDRSTTPYVQPYGWCYCEAHTLADLWAKLAVYFAAPGDVYP